MKDYLIKFNADGRRGTTYADGVHYFVQPDGAVKDGSVKVQDMLDQGFVFVDTVDYLNLLGNNDDKKNIAGRAMVHLHLTLHRNPQQRKRRLLKKPLWIPNMRLINLKCWQLFRRHSLPVTLMRWQVFSRIIKI